MVQICASYRPLSQIRCSVWSAKCATSRFLTRLMVAGNLKENSKLLASRRPRCSSLSASRPPPPLRRCGRLPRSSDAPNRHRISQLPLFLSIGCSCLITLNYLRFSIYVVIVRTIILPRQGSGISTLSIYFTFSGVSGIFFLGCKRRSHYVVLLNGLPSSTPTLGLLTG